MGKISDTIQKKRTALKSVIDEPFSEVFWYENEYKKRKAQAYLRDYRKSCVNRISFRLIT